MFMRAECPECGGVNTTREWTTFDDDCATEVRTCDDCPTQFENVWSHPLKETTWMEEDDG